MARTSGGGRTRAARRPAAQANVVRPGRVDPYRERQAQDLDEDAALGPHRPAAPATDSVERGTRPSAAHGLSVEHHHRRLGVTARYRVEHAFAQLGRWRRLSRCYEGTAASARAWLEVAATGYLFARLRVEPA
jgi:hypothetical protein